MKKTLILVLSLLAFAGLASAQTTKDLGAGEVSPTLFLRASVPSGSVASARIFYSLETNDGDHRVAQSGTETFTCAASNDGSAAASKTVVGTQTETGVGSAPASLLSTMSFSFVVSENTCDFRIANHIIAGTASANMLTYFVEYGIPSGVWSDQ